MRIGNLVTILFVEATTGGLVDYALSALAPQTQSGRPTPSSIPSHIQEVLELRQAPGFAAVAAPTPEGVAPTTPAAAPAAPVIPSAAVPVDPPPAVDPIAAHSPALAAAIPPANQAVPLAPPAASLPLVPATMTGPLPPLLTGDDFVTVQWIETHIGTLRTWVPQTETFHFEVMSQAPLPGIVVGAAPTPPGKSKKVIGAAVAAGLCID
ncbi:hypothetical protein E8E12_006463 [Didymella heteroderae]|uniref:Uncharacterized protein n=1 Tax=Didymella heteroderae TaxID=1769908 RepID=A0A9P4WU67_9PLEO|nr:hypothetical protein E8E12_006463 [Didymella heteroderae]